MKHKKFAHIVRSIAVVSLIILSLSLVNNCKKGVSQADLIVITMTQTEWGLNYSHSMGHIEVFLQGESVDGIILSSIEMKGDNPSAVPLKAESADFVGGNRVRATFEKNRVLALLANPAEGSIHIVIVSFRTEPSGESFDLSAQVTVRTYIDEDGETLPQTLEIDPVEWSLNFINSSGTVEAFIRGEGIDQIDLNSFVMMGDNPLAAPLAAISASINRDHIHARFPMNQVIGLLLDPQEGSTHTIIVSFLPTGGTERIELSAIITIEEDDDIIDPTELTLEIDPVEWSLNFPNSSGTVEAFIRGEGIDQIDLNSFQMMGDNPLAAPLAAISTSINNDQIHARFPMNQVIGLLLNPVEGSTHIIIVSFLPIGGTERIELTAEITIVDDDDIIDPSLLELEIDPVEWSLNFPNSSGTVEAFIRGEGIDQIDLNSFQMMGDNPLALPLAASSTSINNDQIHARFPKNQVIGLLLNPEEGSTHTIIVSFLPIGGTERIELTAVITIEEDDDEEPEPSDLSLQLNPSQWNMNYSHSSGRVTAQIRGTGIENIDLNTIEMEGDNPAAAPLSASSASRQGNHVSADFPKNKVLDLLLNPAKGTTHTVTVSFMLGGERQELSTQVNIH
jgi:hypothetical protein